MQVYIVKKRFTKGILKGMTIEEKTVVKFEPGEKIKGLSGDEYTIEDVYPAIKG